MICTLYSIRHNIRLGAEQADYGKKLSKIADLWREEQLSDGRNREFFLLQKLFVQFFSFSLSLFIFFLLSLKKKNKKKNRTDIEKHKRI